MAVIGRCAAQRLEARTGLEQRSQVAVPGRSVFAVLFAEFGHRFREPWKIRIDNRVGAECGNDAALPSGVANRLVVREIVERRIGGRQQLNLEPLKQTRAAETPACSASRGWCRSRGRPFFHSAARSIRRDSGTHSRARCAWEFRGRGSSGWQRCAIPCAALLFVGWPISRSSSETPWL